MNRRFVVKSLVLFTGGVVLLPSCVTEEKKSSIILQNISVSERQVELMAEVAETIIPATDTPGAKEMGLHLFVLRMLNDCHEQKDQDAFMKGLSSFEDFTNKQIGTSFVDCSLIQQKEVIAAVNERKAPKEVLFFYGTMKDLTIKGYLNSKLVMTELRVYELVPSRYDGYFPVKKSLKISDG